MSRFFTSFFLLSCAAFAGPALTISCVESLGLFVAHRASSGGPVAIPGAAFPTKELCEASISTQASGLICVDKVPFSVPLSRIVRAPLFSTTQQCVEALRTSTEGRICAPLEEGFVRFDLQNEIQLSRHLEESRESCVAKLAVAIAAPEEAPFSDQAVKGCDDVNLELPGGSMEHVLPRYQDELPICFGEVAAQVIDAWRFTH